MLVEILIGNIASGKSTYCKKRASEGAIILSDDSLTCSLHADDYTLYNKSLKPLYKSVENQIVISALTLGKDVVVDRGLNLTPRSRRRFIGLAHSMDAEIHAVCFNFMDPKIHAARRLNHDPRGHDFNHWLEVANRFHNEHIPPGYEEGFDNIIQSMKVCND